MKRRMLSMLALVTTFIVAIGGWKAMQIRAAIAKSASFGPPPTAVTTWVARSERWQPVLSAVGSLKAVNGVTVSTDLAGIVSQIAFHSGKPVNKGDLLIDLDAQQERAQLRSAEARRDMAKLELDRQNALVKDGTVSKSAFDSAETEYRQAMAAVDEVRALIARKTIRAPFGGLLGIRQVDLGQYVNVGEPIVALQSVDPILVEFALPQSSLEQVSVGGRLRLKADGLDGAEFGGEITAFDSHLDEATRNLKVRGTVQNPQARLRPGMFFHVEVLLSEEEVICIPASSVNYAPYGDSVFVVKAGHVEQRFVKLGATRGDQVAVRKGVQAGDEVASSGVFRLRGGMAVQVNNSVQPGNDASPNPPNI